MSKLKAALLDLFSDEDDPSEPFYDPVHVGAAVVGAIAAVGCLYWLLWTLLVYEGGVFMKLSAATQVLLTEKTARDFGYEGPHWRGAFEGWAGTLGAAAASVLLLVALHRLYWTLRRRAR